MKRAWVISDPHFGHQGVCTFTRNDGSPLRPWDDWKEMDEALIHNWNSVVSTTDRVYLLGDVAFNNNAFDRVIHRLIGRIVLIKGNHDILKPARYFDNFDDVRAYHQGKGYIMSHIPIHEQSLERWGFNIHGHLHANIVEDKWGKPDPRYYNASVEQINYTPILLDKILENRP